MPKTFVIGDIHGAQRALLQCLQLSQFNYAKDTLICLGDVADGWPETRQSIGELMKIKNLVYLLGNHDFWTLEWMDSGYADDTWLSQGGQATVNSYMGEVPESHANFLRNAKPYFELGNELFVHAGINPDKPLTAQNLHNFIWDRSFARLAKAKHLNESNSRLTDFDSVYIGHTPVNHHEPLQYCEVWMMDTGAGWSGPLSMMNIVTREFFVSDPVPQLYPGVEGRKRF